VAEHVEAEWIDMDEFEAEFTKPPPPQGPKIILAGVIALVVGLGIGLGSGITYRIATDEPVEPPEPEVITFRVRHDVQNLSTNLRDPAGMRHATIGVSVELETEHPDQEERRVAVVSDATLTLVSDHKPEELLSPVGRTRLRRELEHRLSVLLAPDRFSNLNLTELAVHR
jgi:flagellar basal body-associated protein FliL